MATLLNEKLRSDLVASQKIPIHMDDYISFEDSSAYRFEAIMRKLGNDQGVNNTKVEFMEMGVYPNKLVCSAIEPSGETSIAVDYPAYAHKDNLLLNTRTGEIYIMNEDVGGTTNAGYIKVTKHGGGAGILAATAVNDVLLILPEAHAEGEPVPDGYSMKPEFLSTYVMQSDMSCGPYTDIAEAQGEYGMKQIAINRKLKWIEWKQKKALAFYFGAEQREIVTAGGPRRHTMRGLRNWYTTNRIDYGAVTGGVSLSSIGELMRKVTMIGASSESKLCMAGQNAMVTASALPATAIRTDLDTSKWGWSIKSIVTPFGTLGLMYEPVFSSENDLADVLCVIDTKHTKMLHLNGLKDRIYLDVGDKRDIHNMEDVISGTYGLRVNHEKCGAWGYGIV